MTRVGDWIQTYTGGQFWPMDPRWDEVHLEDIAHALSMLCRFNGHCRRFYSVAEHSVLVSRQASRRNALWGLLHDASEAYLADVPRPVKPFLPGYKATEQLVQDVVCFRFGLPLDMPEEIHEIDGRIVITERALNMAPCAHEWSHQAEPLDVALEFWTPEEAERAFIDEFDILTARRAAA